jgi:hypothetical protein
LNAVQENEALLRESRTLHAALGVSKQMGAVDEGEVLHQRSKISVRRQTRTATAKTRKEGWHEL